MNLETVEKRFDIFLEKYWELSDIAPFLFVYIQLLLLFKDELSQVELNVVLNRKSQLLEETFSDDAFDEIRILIREKMNLDLASNTSTTRRGMLCRLLFCILTDSEENDFFYLVEPISEFVREMEISPVQLAQILESEFDGLKILS